MEPVVLVVDDELHMRTFLATLLETNGFKPLTAEDGIQGFRMAHKHQPALIIMDVMMPSQSGVDLYRSLKKDLSLKSIPVIIVSAVAKKTFFHSQDVLDQYKGESLPEPTAYIEKPPEPDELLEAIQIGLKDQGEKAVNQETV